MNSKQAYQATYRLYRALNHPVNREASSQQITFWIKMVHVLQPKAAAAAHTSFSMRTLFNS